MHVHKYTFNKCLLVQQLIISKLGEFKNEQYALLLIS